MLGLLGLPSLLVLRALWTDAPTGATFIWAGVMAAGSLAGLVPRRWFARGSFETDALYRGLGVRAFGRWLAAIRRKAAPHQESASLLQATFGAELLARLEAQTRANERGHLMWFGATMGATGAALRLKRWDLALWLLGANIIMNLYPILLQRYTRMRLHRCELPPKGYSRSRIATGPKSR